MDYLFTKQFRSRFGAEYNVFLTNSLNSPPNLFIKGGRGRRRGSASPVARPGEISPEGGEGDDEAHLHHGGGGGRSQPDVDTGGAGEEAGEDLLDDDIAGQEHGDHDTQ